MKPYNPGIGHRMPAETKRIRAYMKQKGWKQTAMAEATGIPYQELHRTLNDRKPIYLDEVSAVASVLGVTIDELVRGGEGSA